MDTPAKNAESAIRAGDVNGALDALKASIRSDPSDASKRVFLFQLLCVIGDWDKAGKQLDVAADLDAENGMMAQVGRAVLACEGFRLSVFRGEHTPLVLGEPAEWISWMVQAVGHSAKGHFEQATNLRGRAFEAAPAVGGRLTVSQGEDMQTHEFAWVADADERLGPIVEAVMDGKYYWIPMSHIRQIRLEPPSDLRDMVWAPAEFTWVNGGEAVGLIPTRYPGSEHSEDDAIRLARKTDFVEVGPETFHAIGQRMWATDEDEYAMLTTRTIEIDHPTIEALVEGGNDTHG